MNICKISTSLFAILFLVLFNNSTYAQTQLPYYENFDSSAGMRWTPYRLGTTNSDDFPWSITIHNPYTDPFSMMHTCNTGTAQANDWTVTNGFSFDAGGKIDSIRSWITSTGFPASNDTIGIYLLTGSADPRTATSKTLLYDVRGANFQKDTWIKSTNINIPPTPGTSYIAFRYKTANNCINIFFDNMHLSGNLANSIPVFKAGTDFNISPNPSSANIMIRTKEQFQTVNIYDVAGRRVYHQPYQSTVNISTFPKGIYTIELVDINNRKGISRIVKD